MESIIFNKKNIIREYNHGIESNLYLYNDDGKIVLIKLFKDKIILSKKTIIITDEILLNKRKKIEFIHDSDLFKDEITILKNVFNSDGKYLGYTMILENLLCDVNVSKKKKIIQLKILLEKIKLLNNNGIYYGDFNTRNFLFNNELVKLIDLDNIRIKDYDFDIKSKDILFFEKRCNKDKYIDNYCFNLFTYSYLNRIFEPYALDNLFSPNLPFRMNTKENKKIKEKILFLDNNYDCDDYFIDHLRF